MSAYRQAFIFGLSDTNQSSLWKKEGNCHELLKIKQKGQPSCPDKYFFGVLRRG